MESNHPRPLGGRDRDKLVLTNLSYFLLCAGCLLGACGVFVAFFAAAKWILLAP